MPYWKAIFMVLALAAWSAGAQTNAPDFCCRYPVRYFGVADVNLAPLFGWWEHQRSPSHQIEYSPRPLMAWKRIVGFKMMDQGYQWVVEAEIFTNRASGGKSRIILRNPPVQEEAAFYALKQEVADAALQVTNAEHFYQTAEKAQERAQRIAHIDARSRNWRSRFDAGSYARQSAEERGLADTAQDEETQTRQTQAAAEKQLASLPSAQGRYQIDYFALDTGKVFDGLPVYDLGEIY